MKFSRLVNRYPLLQIGRYDTNSLKLMADALSKDDLSVISDNLGGASEQDDERPEVLELGGVDLLYQMDIEDITRLRKFFFPQSYGKEWLESNPEGLSLNKREFINAMDAIGGGSCVLSLCAAELFDTLDIDDSGLLQWEEVLDAIIEKTGVGRSEVEGICIPSIEKYTMTFIPHCRGESIVKVVPLETDTTFCYAIVSKLGRVGVYDGEFRLLDSYQLGLKPNEESVRDFNEFDSDGNKERQHRRSSSTFLTDAIFVPDTYALLFAASDRSLHLYDATGLVHVPLCHIIGLPNVPTCMAYHPCSENTPGLLFLGADNGDVVVLRFRQAKNTLLKKKHPDKLDIFYWMELSAQSEYVNVKIHKGVHGSAVTQIRFCSDNDTVLSCSRDETRTLVIRHIDDKREPYHFSLKCVSISGRHVIENSLLGIRCFHDDRIIHVLVTGSNDHQVRIWNPVVTQQPLVVLSGHTSPVVDVCIVRFIVSILSFEASGTLKIWHIYDEVCVFTLPLNFPVYKIPGKKIIYGAKCIFPGPLRAQEFLLETRSTKSSVKPEQMGARASLPGSNLDELQTATSNLKISDDEQWQRDSVIIACCNYLATLPLQMNSQASQEAVQTGLPDILPPPTKEHYASAPSPWRVGEVTQPSRTPRGSIGSKSTKSTDSTSTSLPLRGKEAVAAAASVKDIHKRRTQHRIKQEQMQMLVEQGAPHLALDLHPLEPIKFSRPLPMTTRMKEKGIDISDPERLLKSHINRESSVMSRTIRESCGSSAKSSKSSKSVPTRRRTGTSKGRLTPDWFIEATKDKRSTKK